MLRQARGAAVGMAVVLALISGVTGAGASEEPERSTAEAVGAPAQPDAGPAATYVPMPDLGFAHRRSDGGINLFRIPLSDVESDVGTTYSVRSLPASSGYRFDRARVIAGDFGNLTPGDDGTADQVIFHMGSDGGARVFGIGGGSDTAPRLWRVLPRSAGWSWADSRPVAGDVNGDGWDDLVVVHKSRNNGIAWVMLSDGSKLGAPQRWGTVFADVATTRFSLADSDGDGNEDLLYNAFTPGEGLFRTILLPTRADGSGFATEGTLMATGYLLSEGWSFANSRQVAGDVDGDGLADLVTMHRSANGGVIVWVEINCASGPGDLCFELPERWQTLPGWSFANSRQYLADTNGDYVDDLVSVHRSGDGGMYVWRHVSDGSTFLAPERGTALPARSGWSFAGSRESVANTWGDIGP